MTTINTTTKTHGLINRNRSARAQGNVSQPGIDARANRAVGVLTDYDISAKGSKINGWGEKVEAYDVTSPSGNTYEVQVRPLVGNEPSCNCRDWIYRRKINGGLCKHGIAVLALRRAN